jgi:hypothetical protein
MVACSSPGFEAGSSKARGKLCQSLNVLPSEIALLCARFWGAAEEHKKKKTPKIDIYCSICRGQKDASLAESMQINSKIF